MKKNIKLILILLVLACVIAGGIFIYKPKKTECNDILLSRMKGDIIYIKRDDSDNVLKIYTSTASLKDEELLYAHNSVKDKNIINLKYCEENNNILFAAFNDDDNRFGVYEYNLSNNEVEYKKELNPKKIFNLEGLKQGYFRRKVGKLDLVIYTENGDIKMVKDGEISMLKDFTGTYDEEKCSGYIPTHVSQDGKYVFYLDTTNLAAEVETLTDAMTDSNLKVKVLRTDTMEESEYVKYYANNIIFLD